jgi:hypothetical protein
MGAFWGTRVMEIVKKNNLPGLLWKRIKLTTTRKANAKKRLHRVWQVQLLIQLFYVVNSVFVFGIWDRGMIIGYI